MASPQDILINALLEINALGSDQTAIPSEHIALCVSKFNRLTSQWNAKGSLGSYEYTQAFTLPSAVNNFTIGATADAPALVVTGGRAPVKIDSAKRIIAGSSPPNEVPIRVLAFEEWDQLSIPALATNLTLAVYLQPKPKLPVLWCYGFSTGEQLRLSWRNLFNGCTVATIATDIDWQESAEEALTLTLAENLARPFQRPVSQDLKDAARAARLTLSALNNIPHIAYPDILDEGPGGNHLARFLARDI